jgi:hypothetical protein
MKNPLIRPMPALLPLLPQKPLIRVMNEDNARNRCDNGPHNFAVLRHMALNLLSKEPSKGSLRVKIKRAGWKDAYLAKLLAQI